MKKNQVFLLIIIYAVLLTARVIYAEETDPPLADPAQTSSPQEATKLLFCHYGTKKICVRALPDSLGILQIGGDAFPISIGTSGEQKIRLSRIYPLHEEVVLFLKWNDLVYKVRSKLRADTYTGTVRKEKTRLLFQIYNLHRGDVIYVKHRGITYSKTIKKHYDSKWKKVTFTPRSRIRSNGEKITVIIRNKAQKKLDSHTFVLKKGYAKVRGLQID